MATVYIGYRPILKGRNANDSIHYWKGKVGVYSNWSLMNPSHPLDGAPDRNAVLGNDTRLSRPTFLEYIFAGGHHLYRMANAGGGARLDYGRFRPLEYKGLLGASAFPGTFGHQVRVTDYSQYNNYIFDGVSAADIMLATGHVRRFNASYGGAFDPYIFKGVVSVMVNTGQALPVGYDNPYGHNRVLEWRGVPSAQAL
jgi:hypothetical protein